MDRLTDETTHTQRHVFVGHQSTTTETHSSVDLLLAFALAFPQTCLLIELKNS